MIFWKCQSANSALEVLCFEYEPQIRSNQMVHGRISCEEWMLPSIMFRDSKWQVCKPLDSTFIRKSSETCANVSGSSFKKLKAHSSFLKFTPMSNVAAG